MPCQSESSYESEFAEEKLAETRTHYCVIIIISGIIIIAIVFDALANIFICTARKTTAKRARALRTPYFDTLHPK